MLLDGVGFASSQRATACAGIAGRPQERPVCCVAARLNTFRGSNSRKPRRGDRIARGESWAVSRRRHARCLEAVSVTAQKDRAPPVLACSGPSSVQTGARAARRRRFGRSSARGSRAAEETAHHRLTRFPWPQGRAPLVRRGRWILSAHAPSALLPAPAPRTMSAEPTFSNTCFARPSPRNTSPSPRMAWSPSN
jgi:hypothetical protein